MPLISPAPGHTVTQPFDGHNVNETRGWIANDVSKGRRSYFPVSISNPHDHLALDYATAIGYSLVAPQTCVIVAQGTIARFADGSLDGEHYLIAVVRKMPTYQTAFLLTHLSGWVHKVGQRVSQGFALALAGDSGRTTGPHTHFELAIFPADVNVGLSFWNKAYYRYNPALFYAGQRFANSSLVQPNV